MNNNTRTKKKHIMINHIMIITKTSGKRNHRKGHITVVKVITVRGLQKTPWVIGLITETEMDLMIIA